MVRLNRIYTRTGDDGTTALAGGERRPKSDLRVEAYGTIDETNAAIGMAREADIDRLNEKLAPLKSFVLPGGAPAAAALHLARTISRRAERLMVALAATPGERIDGPAMRYVNRLSDLLFVACRAANHNGADDVLWVPGQNR